MGHILGLPVATWLISQWYYLAAHSHALSENLVEVNAGLIIHR